MIEYSKLDEILLEELDFFSSFSSQLLEFINSNNIKSVRDFIECIENSSYQVPTYSDVMLEARGIADLLKYKYLGFLLPTDVYFKKPVREISFYIKQWNSEMDMLGVHISNNNKITLPSLINRLGFSNEERELILSSNVESIVGYTIIDLLFTTFNVVNNKKNKTAADVSFCNKAKILILYYGKLKAGVINKNKFSEKEIMSEIEIKLKQLESLIARHNLLNNQIDMLARERDLLNEQIVDLHKQIVKG